MQREPMTAAAATAALRKLAGERRETAMTTNDPARQGAPNDLHHPAVAAVLTAEVARLRARALELKAMPPPPPPGTDKTETFAKLWAEQWRLECGVAADRLDDAAFTLEEHLKHAGATKLFLDWQKR